jgi:predicted alpha/beta hydrolase
MNETFNVIASDGYSLSVTCYPPTGPGGDIVLINSATGVKQGYYADFARFVADQGFSVYTYDYRGIGKSSPESLVGFNATMHEWGTLDYHAVLKHLFVTYPDSKFTVIGHSVGGQIIGMSPLSENLDNIITIAAQTPYWRNFESRSKLLTFWYLTIPFFTKMFGYFPASKLGLFENLPAGVALQWSRWAKSKSYVFDELPYMKERFRSLHQPALMISFSDDDYAPKGSVTNLMSYFKNLKWNHWHLKPRDLKQEKIGHFGFFKNKQASAWSDLTTWIHQPVHSSSRHVA